MIRSILAVIAGFILWSVVWVGSNSAITIATPGSFREDGGTDSVAILVLLLVIGVLCSTAAGYVTARVSQGQAMRNVWILGIILLVVGIAVESQIWSLLPLWYHLIFLILLIPATLFGGQRYSGSKT